jgi:hypothetical protein
MAVEQHINPMLTYRVLRPSFQFLRDPLAQGLIVVRRRPSNVRSRQHFEQLSLWNLREIGAQFKLPSYGIRFTLEIAGGLPIHTPTKLMILLGFPAVGKTSGAPKRALPQCGQDCGTTLPGESLVLVKSMSHGDSSRPKR